MLNKIKKNNSGFTIIEVLIVLAIAGLILLVVFLAVPALQRNQRNNGYRAEAQRILGAAQEISANNGGIPLVAADGATVKTAANTRDISVVKIEPFASAGQTAITQTTAVIVTGASCTSTLVPAAKPTLTPSTSRRTVLLFTVEDSAGALIGQCQES